MRVSTQEQIDNYSIDIQRERMEAMCKSRGWVVIKEFVDGGFSGSNTNRPGLQEMLSEITNFDIVMVLKLDRLSRSQRDTMELIQDYFLKNKVDFVSVTESLDTSSAFGMAMIGILAVFAELERGTIRERMRGGLIKRAEQGYRSSGGDYDPSGFKRLPNGDLEPIPDEIKHIQRMFDVYEETHSITKMQAKLKQEGFPLWRFTRCRIILSNRLYLGEVSFAGEYYKGRHKAIIDKKQFDRVQKLLAMHKGPNSGRTRESLFSGMIKCSHCGENYVTYSYNVKNKTKGDYYVRSYICRARRYPSEYPQKCFNKSWKNDDLEKIISKEMQNQLMSKQFKDTKKKKIDYDSLLKKIEVKIERIIDLYSDGEIDKNILDKRISKLNIEKEELIERKKQESSNNDFNKKTIEDYIFAFPTADFDKKRAIVEKLIKEIIIDDKKARIIWNF